MPLSSVFRRRVVALLLGALFCCGLLPAAAAAQASPTEQIQVLAVPVVSGYPAGSQLPLVLLLRLAPGQSLPAGLSAGPGSGQLGLELQAGEGVALTRLTMQPPTGEAGSGLRVVVTGGLKVEPSVQAGPRLAEGRFSLPLGGEKPALLDFALPLNILAVDEEPQVVSPEMLARLGVQVSLPSSAEAAAPAAQAAQSGDDPFAGHSLFWLMLLVFIGGLGLNLTPCVYPLIPITISIFGGRARDNRPALLASALAYWLGMAVMYSALGALVSLSGGMLGQALSNPLVTLALALIMLALAASMFGLWELKLPASLTRLGASNRQGLAGAFFMGLTVGILAAPCLGPFVLGLMTHVASVGNLAYGLLVFLALAGGLGLPLAVLAFFSGSITRLPGAGEWMIWVRKLFGVVLVLMAVSVAQPLLGPEAYRWGMTALGVLGGLYLALWEKSGKGGFIVFKRMAGGLVALAALAFFWLQAPAPADGHIAWKAWTPSSFQEAAAVKRPSLVDVTASWCAPCRQLEAETFPDARVVEAMRDFEPFRMDVTNGPPSPEAKALLGQWRVRGVPTIAFLDRQGKLMPELTIVGFLEPAEFAERLRLALSKAGPASPPNQAGGK